jgi:glutathione S-transferase
MTLFDSLPSGNGYKVRLLLAQLDLQYNWADLEIDQGESRSPWFLAKNPNGRIPTLELENGICIAESNAILWYLAEDSEWLPRSRIPQAQVLQWMFFEQYSHEPYVATSRHILKHLPAQSPRRAELPHRQQLGRAALAVMEKHLSDRQFFVSNRYSIADIALFAYTHVAHEAELDLAPFPSVRAWLSRVASQPRHIPMTRRPSSVCTIDTGSP